MVVVMECHRWEVATTGLISTTTGDEYMHLVYYDPATMSWNAYSKKLMWYLSPSGAKDMIMLRILKPPFKQKGYLHIYDIPPDNFREGMFTMFLGVYMLDSVHEMFTKGVPTSQIKQWLLYSGG